MTEQLAWDANGNVSSARERGFQGASPTLTHELLTSTEYAVDPTGRLRQRVSRVVQHDGITGALISDLRMGYDGRPEGQVGALGLVTERMALALTDQQVTAIYGGDATEGPEAEAEVAEAGGDDD